MHDDLRGRDLKRLTADAPERSAELAGGLAAAADERGLLDIALGTVDSPLGRLDVAVTDRGLLEIAFPEQDRATRLAVLSERVSPRILNAPAKTDNVRRELDEYFEGSRTGFDLRLDRRLLHGFQLTTLRATERIPYGRTATYGELAERIGSPRAARAVGNALGSNPIPIVIPCHRVLRTGGALGGYGGGLSRKQQLLALEEQIAGDP